MRNNIRILIGVICLLSVAEAGLAQATTDESLGRLEREIVRLSEASGGTVGVAAVHIESGRQVSLNRRERFPMASTYKVPIAVQLLDRVDRGEVRLEQMVEVLPSDLHPGSGTLTDLFNQPGVSLSVRNLLELMMLISDNSATDVLLRVAGGPTAVTDKMRALGIEGIDVNRPTAELIAHFVGVFELPPPETWTIAWFRSAFAAVTPELRREASNRFDTDPRDTSTPEAMAELLVKIHQKEILKPGSAELLLDIMYRCRTGQARLKGLLPQGTAVANKTGTVGRSTNDVGIIRLPDGAGHVALAVFVKASERDIPARERAIAEIARAVHDYFLFVPAR